MRTTARKKIRDKFIIALQLQKKTSNWISRYFKSTILYQAHITKFPLMIGKIWIKSWSAFLVSYYYIPFFAIVVQGWFDSPEWENAGISQVHSNTTHIIVAVVWFFFVVSQWRSFIKWQRIFRFLVELFKEEF